MNKAQKKCLQRLTQRIQFLHDRIKYDGRMAYRITETEAGGLVFSARNAGGEGSGGGLRWFETTRDFYAIIGPKGGVRKYEGNIQL